MPGKFVAFSKRINSVLTPAVFLHWATRKFAEQDQETHFFPWRDGEIDGPPLAASVLREKSPLSEGIQEVSALHRPAERMPLAKALSMPSASTQPGRLIVRVEDPPPDDFLVRLEKLGYETNRETPAKDWLGRASTLLALTAGGVGALFSLLSLATFAASFRLSVAQSAQRVSHIFLLGFAEAEIARVFHRRFFKTFSAVLCLSILLT